MDKKINTCVNQVFLPSNCCKFKIVELSADLTQNFILSGSAIALGGHFSFIGSRTDYFLNRGINNNGKDENRKMKRVLPQK